MSAWATAAGWAWSQYGDQIVGAGKSLASRAVSAGLSAVTGGGGKPQNPCHLADPIWWPAEQMADAGQLDDLIQLMDMAQRELGATYRDGCAAGFETMNRVKASAKAAKAGRYQSTGSGLTDLDRALRRAATNAGRRLRAEAAEANRNPNAAPRCQTPEALKPYGMANDGWCQMTVAQREAWIARYAPDQVGRVPLATAEEVQAYGTGRYGTAQAQDEIKRYAEALGVSPLASVTDLANVLGQQQQAAKASTGNGMILGGLALGGLVLGGVVLAKRGRR